MSLANGNLSIMLQKVFDPEIMQTMPESMQRSPLKSLNDLRGTFSAAFDPSRKTKLKELQSEHNLFYGKIKQLCSQDQQRLTPIIDYLEKCLDINTEIVLLDNEFNYEQGIRDGFWLAMEILGTGGEK